VLIASVLALAACTLDPEYERPALPTAPAYPSAGPAYAADRTHLPAAVPQTPADLVGWRQVFTDPRLQALIALALENNRDLRIAILNIAAAQAQYRAQWAQLFPVIDITGNATIEGEPTSVAEPTGAPSSTPVASGTSAPTASGAKHDTSRLYQAGIGTTSWEIDLFGQIRSQTRAQFELYLAQIENRRSTQISLVAQVANAYIVLIADQEQLKIAQQTQDAQSRSYALTEAMFNHGSTTLLSLRQAETTVDTARASVAQYTRQVAQDENALTLLLGAPIPATLQPGRDLVHQEIMADLPAGLPSALLERRPDITAAEHTLLSANAEIGAARAAFFPSITLTATGGLASNYLNKLFTPAAYTWTFAPQITIPIFTWGENLANLDYANVQKRIDIATYEKTIQTAFREVSDGLAARGTDLDQLAAQLRLVKAYTDAYNLAAMRFRGGLDSFLATLESQQSLFTAEQTLISLKAAQLQNLVTLYKALGGGWYADTANEGAPG
jgi:multidrug efflux system outer membrane protein